MQRLQHPEGVHGSLARAGKVRNQTPKVAKQEKKKLATGRAKKRIQYNRRFVNVVTAPGGKKVGPNSNAGKGQFS
jgi:small subunit ribosomal protein S30e